MCIYRCVQLNICLLVCLGVAGENVVTFLTALLKDNECLLRKDTHTNKFTATKCPTSCTTLQQRITKGVIYVCVFKFVCFS